MSTTTTLSSKGQVIIPKTIRDRMHWMRGQKLSLIETPDGVLLKAQPAITPTRLDDVAGCLPYSGPAKRIEDMDAAIARGVAERFDSDV